MHVTISPKTLHNAAQLCFVQFKQVFENMEGTKCAIQQVKVQHLPSELMAL